MIITFIIPTKGRPSLKYTLESLVAQTDRRWGALVVGDGHDVNPDYLVDDPRIRTMAIPKVGRRNSAAGEVRNQGIKTVKTPWIGFVDDDDALTPNYVEDFYKEVEDQPETDVIIFRMTLPNGNVFPALRSKTFQMGRVGISFALKTSLFKDEDYWFVPSRWEDYNYLDTLRKAGKAIHLSACMTYIVRPNGKIV